MGNKEANGSEGSDRRRREGRVRKGSLKQETSDFRIGGSDPFEITSDGQDTVLNALDNLGDTCFNTGGVANSGDGGA